MKIKKWIAAGLATIMMTGMLTGCGKNIRCDKRRWHCTKRYCYPGRRRRNHHINLVGASGRKCF